MATRSSVRFEPVLALLALTAACSHLDTPLTPAPPPNPTFSVLVSARDDSGRPLRGVALARSKAALGTTDATGSARLTLEGSEGQTLALNVKCPEGFASPEKPLSVSLRHLTKGSPPPRFEARCVALQHTVVVGIRAEAGANLPILHLKKPVAQTDAAGVGHFLLHLPPGEQVSLTLDTTGRSALRPQNPSLTFVAPDHDELILLEQKFTVLKPRVAAAKKRSGPTPL